MTVAQSFTTAQAGYHTRGAAGCGSATPSVLVPALMELVIGHVGAASRCLPHAPRRSELIEEARTIIGALRDTLDLCDVGLATNLHDVYGYMCRQLGTALLGGRGAELSEVAHLMHEVRAAWSAMPQRASAGPA